MSFKVVQERDAVPGRPLVLVSLAAFAITLLAVWVASRLLGDAGRHAHGAIVAEAPATTQGIVEQSPLDRSDRAAVLRARDSARLETYGWVDETHRVAHIPIARAIDLYVAAHADGGTP